MKRTIIVEAIDEWMPVGELPSYDYAGYICIPSYPSKTHELARFEVPKGEAFTVPPELLEQHRDVRHIRLRCVMSGGPAGPGLTVWEQAVR